MKNKIWISIVLIIILMIVFGILYGWFRKEEKLDQDEIDILNKIKYNPSPVPSTDVQSELSKLWYDHVRLTREVIVGTFNDNPDLPNLESALLKNQEDIGNVIEKYYSNSGGLVAEILKEHIREAKIILQDLKYKKLGRLSHDINRWYANADKFAEVMATINPAWQLKSHMAEHLRITEREAIYEWLGAKKLSLDIYNDKIVPQAQGITKSLVAGLPQ